MRKIFLIIVIFAFNIGYSQVWITNFNDAKAIAKKENKKIVLVFSGSDWCAPCMKLEKVVWKSEAFQAEAQKKWVLVKADFPKKKSNQLAPEITLGNKILAEKYNKEGSFPLVVLLSESGKILGMTGFKNVTAEKYIAILNAIAPE